MQLPLSIITLLTKGEGELASCTVTEGSEGMNTSRDREPERVVIDPEVVRLRRHALWSLMTFLGLGLVWVVIAILFAYQDPLAFPMVLGLPLWVFLVLIVGGLTALAIQLFFAYWVFNEGADE
jgi:hypothetical protein